MRGTCPEQVEKDVAGKGEELFENHVKLNEGKEIGLNTNVFEEKNNEEDYNHSVELEP